MSLGEFNRCLSEQELTLLLDESESIGASSISHVDSCSRCQQRLETLSDSEQLEGYREPVRRGLVQRLTLEDPIEPGDLGAIDGIPIKSKIAEGGMGIVYRGYDLHLNRTVAVKVLSRLDSSEGNARFLREILATAKLDHPNVVPVYSAGRAKDGRPYLVMPFIDGESLRQRIQCSTISVKHAVELVRQTALGLSEAHRHGIVHRDVTSSNILIDHRDGNAKLTDFGLVRSESDVTLTTRDIMCGTPDYMSPEQIQNPASIDARADIYSLGVVYYEALTGTTPFHGRPLDILEQHRSSEPVPPSRLNRQVSRDCETICLKALQKDPEHRYQTAQEFAEDLGRLQRNEVIRARRISRIERIWRWAKRNPLVSLLSSALGGSLVTAMIVTTILWRDSVQKAHEVAKKNAELEQSISQLRTNQVELAAAMRGSAVARLGDKQQTMELPTGVRNQMMIEIVQTWRLLLGRSNNNIDQLRGMADELILVNKSAAELKMRNRLQELTDLSKDIVDQIATSFGVMDEDQIRTAIIYKQYGEARPADQLEAAQHALEKAESIAHALVDLNENGGIYGTQSAAVLMLDAQWASIKLIPNEHNEVALQKLEQLWENDQRLRQIDSANYFVIQDWYDLEQRIWSEKAFRMKGQEASAARQKQLEILDLLIQHTQGTTDTLLYSRRKAQVLAEVFRLQNLLGNTQKADEAIQFAEEIITMLVRQRPLNTAYRVTMFDIRILRADNEWDRGHQDIALTLYDRALREHAVVLEFNPLDPTQHHRAAELFEQLAKKYSQVGDHAKAGQAYRAGASAAQTSGNNPYGPWLGKDLEYSKVLLEHAVQGYERADMKAEAEEVRQQIAKQLTE